MDPSARSRYPIEYPREEERRGIKGTVIVQISFDSQGNVTDTSIASSSGNRNLDRAALKGVKRWQVAPGMRNGQKVGGTATVRVDFQ